MLLEMNYNLKKFTACQSKYYCYCEKTIRYTVRVLTVATRLMRC